MAANDNKSANKRVICYEPKLEKKDKRNWTVVIFLKLVMSLITGFSFAATLALSLVIIPRENGDDCVDMIMKYTRYIAK